MLLRKMCIGIDLGTTNSAVFNLSQDKPEAIPNGFGDLITPSVVFATENGLLAGRSALNERIYAPKCYACNFKRHMGERDDDGNSIPILTGPDGRQYTAEDCSAAVLQELISSAEKYLNEKIEKAVITVPAYFGAKAKETTKAAAEKAGLKEAILITEPVSASVAYDPKQDGKNKVAVFDFGGGTFDMSIIETDGAGHYDVLSISGDQNLGGSDLDDLLINYAIQEANKQECHLDADKNLQVFYDLKDSCCRAKETLSRSEKATICVDNRETICKVMIDRSTFNKLAKEPILNRIEMLCMEALEKAKISPQDIDIVLLVGGSSRNFFVSDIIQKIFLKGPRCDIDMDKAVAMGAAIYAAICFSDKDKPINVGGKTLLPSEVLINNICARDLCIAAIREPNGPEYNSVLIPTGSGLPFTKTFQFSPSHPSASKVNIKLYDGGTDQLSKNHVPLKTATLQVQPVNTDTENKNRIEISVKMSDEGLVNIEAVDTFLNQPIAIELNFNVSKQNGNNISNIVNE